MKSDVKIRYKKLKPLEPLLHKWIDLNNGYCKAFPGDSLYWYNERATLSSLAAAVWKGNGYALEEYRTDKRFGKDQWPGRSDLWFSWGKTDYLVEAKQIWSSLFSLSRESFEKISEALKVAKSAVVENREDVGNRLGVVFVVPYIPPSKKADREDLIKKFIEKLL